MKTVNPKAKAPSGDGHYAEAVAWDDQDHPRPRAQGAPAFLEVKKIVREEVPLQVAPGGTTMGKLIDDYLAEQALGGAEVKELTLSIDEEYWFAYSRDVQVRETNRKKGY